MFDPISNLAHTIQLAIAPIFMLTGIGALLNTMNVRLVRVVDRRRVIQRSLQHVAPGRTPHTLVTTGQIADHEAPINRQQIEALQSERAALARRGTLIYSAILAEVCSAFLICLVIMSAFISSIAQVDVSSFIAILFILSMSCTVIGLAFFFGEVSIAVRLVTNKEL